MIWHCVPKEEAPSGVVPFKKCAIWHHEQKELVMAIENDDVGPGWDGVQPPTKGGGKRQADGLSLFMRLEPRKEPYHFRLACTPVKFRKHRWAFRSLKQYPISPATDPSEKDLDVAWREGKFVPPVRYAALVFDRDNNNRLRILEEGPDVFGPIGNDAHATNTNHAGNNGWDWIAIVTEEVVDGTKKRKYQVVVDRNKGVTKFTEDEVKALDNPKFQRSELETRYFAKSTPQELEDLWEQLPASSRKNEPSNGRNQNTRSSDAATTKDSAPKASEPVVASAKPVQSAPNVEKKESTPDTSTEPTEEIKDDFLADSEPEAADADEESARMF